MKRIEKCVNVQARVPTDETVKNFGMQIKGQMMEVRSLSVFIVVKALVTRCRAGRPAQKAAS